MILNSPFITGSITVTNNVVTSGSLTVLGTINGAVTGSVNSASYAAFAATANSASYAATSSFASNFNVANTLTATTLVVNTVSSSVVFSSGSNVFGNALSNTQVMTGSVNITGSLSVNGTIATLGTGTSGYIPKWSGSLTLDNSLIYENVNSIGIGTISPNAYDPSGNNLVVYEAGNAGITIATGATNFGSILFARETGTAGAYRGYIEYGQSADYMAFGTVSAERMRITSGGSVGIGTTSPSTPLHVNGAVTVGNNTGNPYINITGGSGGGGVGTGPYLQIFDVFNFNGWIQQIGAANGRLAWFGYSGSWAERMTLTQSGNLGIGTTSPTNGYRLDVVGSILSQVASGNTSIVVQTNNANGAINAIAGTGLEIATDGTNQNIVFRTGNTEKVRILANGTTSFGGDLFTYQNGGIFFNTAGNYASGIYSRDAGVNLILQAGGAERMRILSDGSVAIGSTTRANVWGLLTLRNTSNSSTQRWGIGPDTNNSLTIYNPSNVGVYITDGGTSWTANSDINLKNIESYIDNAIDSIMTLSAIKFNWKSDEEKKTNIGLIAQEVQKIYPELIDKNADGYLGVRYTELIPILVKAIQELKAELDTIKQQI